ncbi:response regulator [Spirosoma validum]|uniref:Response regulator transcription factor n=1 Tax=Spirosoma validum TaxID=2771355 RepID=A0A927B0M2_9BACT|nr:response regulator transcription factor [Spirosoma validum]MBD2753087.1 response regulator transcription factor [Spirosoma validum]
MKIRTVIIDDHALFNDGLALILKESELFEVVGQVYDSRQAMYICQGKVLDLILVDYNMPHVNGLEVVAQLKTLLNKPRIVIISMYAQRKELNLFSAAGVDGYLAKTTPSAELIASLQKIMAGDRILSVNRQPKESTVNDFFALKHQLTKREYEIVLGLKEGKTTEQIAQAMGLSYLTVETHRKNINAKLKLTSRQEFYDFLQSL